MAEPVSRTRDGDDGSTRPLVYQPTPRKGRGAIANVRGRYEVDAREALDDGWDGLDRTIEDAEGRAIPTIVTEEIAKTILSSNDSPDIPFRLSLNPYRGCEHGCIYCFARPTHSYLGLSPGLDFETRIFAKTNAATLLKRELAKRSYEPDVIAVGVNTDAYQPAERELKITRRVLEVLHDGAQSVRAHHQIIADRTRHRPARAARAR